MQRTLNKTTMKTNLVRLKVFTLLTFLFFSSSVINLNAQDEFLSCGNMQGLQFSNGLSSIPVEDGGT